MPSTHVSLHYHVVFSTKARARIIADPWRAELHAYLGGVLHDLQAIPESIGGTGDHVHALIGLKATHSVAEVLRQMKRGSSEWIHRHGVRQFQWQEGYGAFTVSAANTVRVAEYIAKQEEHHRTQTFEEEYRSLLTLCGVSYDEQYLW